jgi:IS30 family transposase
MATHRWKFTESVKEEVWARWRKGEPLNQIARAMGTAHSSLGHILSEVGGIKPPKRTRSKSSLSLSDREEISRGLCQGLSLRAIARELNRAPSTVSREVKRNEGRDVYRATASDQKAWDQARRPKICKLADKPRLCRCIGNKLQSNWSPQQIAGWLKNMNPDDETQTVSHETIYRSLFVQARGVLKKELIQYLRTRRTYRHPKNHTMKNKNLGKIKDAISISERPAEVEDRAVPGHWEGDLIIGNKATQIATLVERKTRFVMLVRVPRRDTETVVNALIKNANKLPREVYKSLTWDRGSELSGHKKFTLATDIDVYFCDPASPWQRGSNENTNRLLRQYFPKGSDLSKYTQRQLDAVANQLNTRPRKTLDYDTPADRFNQCVASTG